MAGRYTGGYYCNWCDHPTKYLKVRELKTHTRRYHPEITEVELQTYVVKIRYPHMDPEVIAKRYADKLETVYGLLRKGYHYNKYFEALGILRSLNADAAIEGVLRRNPHVQTAEDVAKIFEDKLVGKFRNASPQKRFEGYLNRDISIMRKKGQEDLIPAVTALKTIEFVRSQLQEAQKKKDEEDAKATEEDKPATD